MVHSTPPVGNNDSNAEAWLNYFRSIPNEQGRSGQTSDDFNNGVKGNKIQLARFISQLTQSQYNIFKPLWIDLNSKVTRFCPINNLLRLRPELNLSVRWIEDNIDGNYFPSGRTIFGDGLWAGRTFCYLDDLGLRGLMNDIVSDVAPPPIELPEVIRSIPTDMMGLRAFSPDDPQELVSALNIAINFQGSEFFNNQKTALRQLLESFQRNDLTIDDAISIWNKIMSEDLTTREEVEILAQDPIIELNDYYVLTPARTIIDELGNEVQKIRTLSIRPLTDEQVQLLLDQQHDVALASNMDILSYARLFSEPIRVQGSTGIINDQSTVISDDRLPFDEEIIFRPPDGSRDGKSGLGILALLFVAGG